MIFLLIPIAFLFGALGRRIAGGVLNTWAGYDTLNRTTPGYNFRVMGDTPARLIYGALVGLAALMGGAVWWMALAMVPAVWVGTTTGNGGGRDAGFGATSFWHDFWGMSEHALLSALAPCLLVVGFVWWRAGAYSLAVFNADDWIFCLTMLAAPLYWLGWRIAIALGGQEMPPNNLGGTGNGRLFAGLQGGSEWGEALWGGAVAVGTFLAFAVR